MKKWVKLFGGMATTAMAVGMSACSNSSTQAKYDKTLSWMTTSEIQTLDQNKMVDTTSGEQADNVFEGLNRIDNHGNVKPAVATKSVPSKDGKTWTFTLRKNARWSNGDPVTADDFVYSLQRTLDPKTHSQQQNIYQAVKNADEVVAGKVSSTKLGVEAKDKHTLVVHLKHPVPYFKTMTASTWDPVNKKVVEKYGKKYGTTSKYMVYNGPYVHKGWTGSNLTWKLKSSAVSSRPVAWGTEDFRSPSTSSFIRSAQARMGTLMLLDSFKATTMDATIETKITRTLMRMPKYVSAR